MDVEIGKNTYKTVLLNDLCILPEAGGNAKNILDRMKIRININVLFRKVTFKFHEGNMTGGTDGIKIGDVRAVSRNWTRTIMPMNIKGPIMYQDIYLYETLALNIIPIKIPFNPGYVTTNMHVSVGLDCNK